MSGDAQTHAESTTTHTPFTRTAAPMRSHCGQSVQAQVPCLSMMAPPRVSMPKVSSFTSLNTAVTTVRPGTSSPRRTLLTLPDVPTWEWQRGGGWADFDDRTNLMLETAYSEFLGGQRNGSFEIVVNRRAYRINLKHMKQVNLTSMRERRIRRSNRDLSRSRTGSTVRGASVSIRATAANSDNDAWVKHRKTRKLSFVEKLMFQIFTFACMVMAVVHACSDTILFTTNWISNR